MDCKQADNLLIDFLYGELSPGDRAAFQNHLQSCPEHAREVEKLRNVLNLVRAQEPEEVPEAISARILQSARARMPQKPRPAPFLSLIWNPVAAAAVLVVVVITVGLATHFMSEQAPEEEPALEAARPLAVAEEPVERAVPAAKAEEKKEFAPAPEPKLAAKAPEEKGLKKPRKKKRRRPPARKRAFKSAPAPTAKTPGLWAAKPKPEPSVATEARGGAAAGKTASTIGKADRVTEGTAGEAYRREKKAKDKKKVSRPPKEREFAEPPPPAKPAPPPREEIMEAESAAPVTMDLEDESYSQAPAPRAKKSAERAPSDYYRAAEADLADKRYDAAVSKYRKFLARNPSDPRAPTCRYRIAKALFLAGRCAEAVGAISAAVNAAPRHPMAPGALLDQGSCYEKLNRLSEANATYRRINRDYPSYREEAEKGMHRTRREVDVKPAATEQHR
jgi:TolA-binding protein